MIRPLVARHGGDPEPAHLPAVGAPASCALGVDRDEPGLECADREPKASATTNAPTTKPQAVIAAAEVHELAPLAFRLGAEMGVRRSDLAALRWDKFVGEKVVADGQIIVSTCSDGVRTPRLKPTRTGSRRVVTLSGDKRFERSDERPDA